MLKIRNAIIEINEIELNKDHKEVDNKENLK